MRLIDADELSEQYGLEAATKYGNKDAEQQTFSYSTMMMYEVADMIDGAPTIEAVPMSVIENIKAEIEQKQYYFMADKDYDEGIRFGLMLAYQIVDKHTSRKEQEEE